MNIDKERHLEHILFVPNEWANFKIAVLIENNNQNRYRSQVTVMEIWKSTKWKMEID